MFQASTNKTTVKVSLPNATETLVDVGLFILASPLPPTDVPSILSSSLPSTIFLLHFIHFNTRYTSFSCSQLDPQCFRTSEPILSWQFLAYIRLNPCLLSWNVSIAVWTNKSLLGLPSPMLMLPGQSTKKRLDRVCQLVLPFQLNSLSTFECRWSKVLETLLKISWDSIRVRYIAEHSIFVQCLVCECVRRSNWGWHAVSERCSK